jgi:type II secretory pathway component PulF
VDNPTSEERGRTAQARASGAEAQAALRFIRQFSVKLKAGLSVEKCLAALVNETRNRRLQGAVREMHKAVVQGIPVSYAMRGEGAFFDICVVGLVERGEQTRKLRAALASVADYLEHKVQLEASLRSAVARPLNALSLVLLATFVATVVLSFLVREVLPAATSSQPVEISTLDRIAFSVSEAVRVGWPFVGFVGLLCFIALKLIPRLPATRAWLDVLALRLPLVGPAVQSSGLAFFFRTIAVRMQAGTSLASAMKVAAITAPNRAMGERIAATIQKIEKNRPYIDALVEDGFLRLGDVTAVQAAERRGDLGAVMLTLAGDREPEAVADAKKLRAVMHTLVVALLGLAILGVVLTLYVPVFIAH